MPRKFRYVFSSEDFVNALVEALHEPGTEILDPCSHVLTTWLASYGVVAQARDEGRTHYVWKAQLDDDTCQTCRDLHGRRFEVEPALKQLEKLVLSKEDQKWPDDVPVEEMVASIDRKLHDLGPLAPPAHVTCRCSLQKD